MRVYIHYLDGRVEVADNVTAIELEKRHNGDYFIFKGCLEEDTTDDWSESYNDKRISVDEVDYFVWR